MAEPLAEARYRFPQGRRSARAADSFLDQVAVNDDAS
jgi:hypothetical protein